MKKLLTIILITSNLLSHSIVDDSNKQVNMYKCKKIFKWFKKPIKHDFYTNVDNHIVGLTYEECDNKKDKFKKLYKFYVLIQIDKNKAHRIENGIFTKTNMLIYERYKVDMQQYLYYETLNDKR